MTDAAWAGMGPVAPIYWAAPGGFGCAGGGAVRSSPSAVSSAAMNGFALEQGSRCHVPPVSNPPVIVDSFSRKLLQGGSAGVRA